MLDEAGFPDAIISASNDLDEYIISELKAQGAKISLWGVGTRLITSQENPAFGGVYKLAALSKGGEWENKIKLSNDPIKITNPGIKKLWRIYDAESGKMKADLIALATEEFSESNDLTIFDPRATWKKMHLSAGEYRLRELLQPVFVDGKCVHKPRTVPEICAFAATERATLWDEHKRLVRPQLMPVDLSQKLFDLKADMIEQFGRR
jgi:nicotinate phosphoribosyltransferase